MLSVDTAPSHRAGWRQFIGGIGELTEEPGWAGATTYVRLKDWHETGEIWHEAL